MDDDPFERAVAAAKATKRNAVAREGVGADVGPVLQLSHDDEFLGAFPLSGVPRDQMLNLIATIIALSDAPVIHFLHEGYRELFTGSDQVAVHELTYEYGSLAQRFAAGDKRVLEVVAIMVASATGAIEAAFLPYHYKGRKVVWIETPSSQFDESDPRCWTDGDVIDAITSGFAGREGQGLPPERISGVLDLPVILPPRPARNGPCPCGSGRKAKVCCGN
jgi:hypothetical protein